MKTIVYFHGIHGDTQNSVAPWLANEFQKFGYKSFYPKCFADEQCSYSDFKKVADTLFDKGVFGDECIVIGHSVGNALFIKYCFERKLKIKAYVSLAGFCEEVPFNNPVVRENIYAVLPNDKEMNYVKNNIPFRVSLYSNDHIVPEQSLINFAKKLNAKAYFLQNKGHFGRKHGVQELPELIDILKNEKVLSEEILFQRGTRKLL